MSERKCYCNHCNRSRVIDVAIQQANPKIMARVIRKLQNDLCMTEEDLSLKECILDGSWPFAMKHLTQGITKAFQIQLARATR